MDKKSRKRLGDLLLGVGKITHDQLDKAINIQRQNGGKLGEVMVQQGIITEDDIIQVLESQLGIPHVKLEHQHIDQEACLLIPENLARRYNLIPITITNEILTIAMSDPLNVFAVDDVKIYSGYDVNPVIATIKEIDKAIDKYYGAQKAMQAVEEFKKEQTSTIRITSNASNDKSEDEIKNAPAVKLVNSIIEQAVRNRASDIHIEPFEDYVKIRFRTDGQLYEIMRTETDVMPAIAARIKIIGGMNIAEKRLPQDGRIDVEIDDRNFDLRVSIMPTVMGEKIAIRIAEDNVFLLSKDKLGFFPEDIIKFENLLKNPYGIIIITGPTGSGKTTTLYSAIRELNKPNVNIVTIEDPVECFIEGVNQIQVNSKTGLTFALGLRSILRQDPNIIMVGEIRDYETAEIAIKAAMTGHLVVSTLHTNDASSSLIRLIDMGIKRYMVASSISGVISQRLVRKICSSCKTEIDATHEQLLMLGQDVNSSIKLYYGKGCPVCNKTGYKGRIGVYEIMIVSKKHRELLNNGCTVDELQEFCIANGMTSLRQSVYNLMVDGITSFDEMMSIFYSNN